MFLFSIWIYLPLACARSTSVVLARCQSFWDFSTTQLCAVTVNRQCDFAVLYSQHNNTWVAVVRFHPLFSWKRKMNEILKSSLPCCFFKLSKQRSCKNRIRTNGTYWVSTMRKPKAIIVYYILQIIIIICILCLHGILLSRRQMRAVRIWI